jgi:hypothetical protein
LVLVTGEYCHSSGRARPGPLIVHDRWAGNRTAASASSRQHRPWTPQQSGVGDLRPHALCSCVRPRPYLVCSYSSGENQAERWLPWISATQ